MRGTLAGIARQHGMPARRAAVLGTAVPRLVAACTHSPFGQRDCALLLSFAAVLRAGSR